jgi:hypothetical protein
VPPLPRPIRLERHPDQVPLANGGIRLALGRRGQHEERDDEKEGWYGVTHRLVCTGAVKIARILHGAGLSL